MRYIQLVLLLPVLTLWLTGCGVSPAVEGMFSKDRMAVAPYDPNSLWNLKLGRDYVGQGRYELAKEHYLMALASANDPESREMIEHELRSVDLMIKTQR